MFALRFFLILGFTIIILSFPCGVIASPTIVYNNTSTAVTGSWTPDGFWPFNSYNPYEPTGDQITLADTCRIVTEFDLIFSSSQQVTLSSPTLSFYENDGIDAYGLSGRPGTMLWTTTTNDVNINGITTVVFSVPNVVVPDTFTWIVQADSNYAGLATYDPPTIGSSDDFFWDYDISVLKWYPLMFKDIPLPQYPSDPVANFGAKVLAIPEPTTLMLLALNGLAIVCKKGVGFFSNLLAQSLSVPNAIALPG